MTGHGLRTEFESRGVKARRGIVFEEDPAVALINRAEDEYVAVVNVELVPEEGVSRYEAARGHSLPDVERLRSWNSAREFVENLSGRGLYFDVVLEPSYATYLGRLRYLFRTGASWSGHAGGEGNAIQ